MRDWFAGIHEKRVEPVERLVGGVFRHAIHRFPIKGGISVADLMAKNICANNALLRKLMAAGNRHT